MVIEKPIALTWSGVQEIYKAITESKVKSVTSFVLRWNPQFLTIKQLIADGVVGDLLYAEADYWHPMKRIYPSYPWTLTRELGGSAFVAAGCHAADALRYFGGEVSEVAAFSTGPKRDMGYEFDPVVVASLKFENGAVGKLSSLVDGETPYVFNIRLFGNVGTIQNNRVYSSKHYPGVLITGHFRPSSRTTATSPIIHFRRRSRTSSSASTTTSNRTHRSTTPTARWPFASPSTSRRPGAACPSRSTTRSLRLTVRSSALRRQLGAPEKQGG